MKQRSTGLSGPQPPIDMTIGNGNMGHGADVVQNLLMNLNDPMLRSLLSPKQIEGIRREFERLHATEEKATALALPKPVNLKQHRANLLKLSEFPHYILTFPERERFTAFQQLLPQLADKNYWELVREVWLMQETIYPNVTEWLGILSATRGDRHHLMSEDERAVLAAAPEEIIIWRGCGHEDGKRGLSWTLNEAQAKFFAEYACGNRRAHFTASGSKNPIVVSAVCRKADVLAYFDGREEAEVVVDPKNVSLRNV